MRIDIEIASVLMVQQARVVENLTVTISLGKRNVCEKLVQLYNSLRGTTYF